MLGGLPRYVHQRNALLCKATWALKWATLVVASTEQELCHSCLCVLGDRVYLSMWKSFVTRKKGSALNSTKKSLCLISSTVKHQNFCYRKGALWRSGKILRCPKLVMVHAWERDKPMSLRDFSWFCDRNVAPGGIFILKRAYSLKLHVASVTTSREVFLGSHRQKDPDSIVLLDLPWCKDSRVCSREKGLQADQLPPEEKKD